MTLRDTPAWLHRQATEHPIRSAALLCLLVTLAMANLRLFAPGGPWWRGWSDQRLYLESARAFAALDLDPARHWYPLLYPLTGAPFAWMPAPFVPANIACYAAAFAGFRSIAARFGLGPAAALAVFALATLAPGIGRLWVEPWTSTLSAALIWPLLAVTAAMLAGERMRHEGAALGALAALVALARPADAVICLAAAPFALWRPLRERRLAVPLRAAGAGAAVLAGYALLHLAVHGPRWSDYVLLSREYGFAFGDLGWRAVTLLVAPGPWFPGARGLLADMPWLLLGVAGLLLGLFAASRGQRALAACLGLAALAYALLLIAYVDLLPTGLWRFGNIHYFKWMFPLLALFALLFVRWARGAKRTAAGIGAALLLLGCLRFDARPAQASEPARALLFTAPEASWEEIYRARSLIADARGTLRNGFEYHQMLRPEGDVVAVALRRGFAPGGARWIGSPPPGAARWPRGHLAPETRFPGEWPRRPVARWGERLAFGYPCWLPPWPCG